MNKFFFALYQVYELFKFTYTLYSLAFLKLSYRITMCVWHPPVNTT